MMPTHIEHIGIAVKNIEESLPIFERLLGTPCYAVEEVADQKVRTAFFKVGQTKIELLEPTGPESPIAKFIEKRGEGIHHLALAVADLSSSLGELQNAGAQLIDARPRTGAEGLQIAFLHPKSTNSVLVELCSAH
jgi:methylmalonyl-CoA/ethylmalonyl-CoA epimerase